MLETSPAEDLAGDAVCQNDYVKVMGTKYCTVFGNIREDDSIYSQGGNVQYYEHNNRIPPAQEVAAGSVVDIEWITNDNSDP